jgi:hypothetical protein
MQTWVVFKLGDVAFGDNVRIVDDDATRRSGHANLAGVCHGMTTPSATGVEVIGDATDDIALNVHFEGADVEDSWFAPDLVVLVDHAAGSTATVGDHSFVKTSDGEWLEVGTTDTPARRPRWFRRS